MGREREIEFGGRTAITGTTSNKALSNTGEGVSLKSGHSSDANLKPQNFIAAL
jgi:hypothetical protein